VVATCFNLTNKVTVKLKSLIITIFPFSLGIFSEVKPAAVAS
jgi:hypothetical protein